jgi:quinol monooxygenase YgiN
MERELIVKWRIKESETSRILKMLPELAEQTKKEEGNLCYMIYQSESNPNELILQERYKDQNAVEAHKNSEHYQRIVVKEIIPILEIREVVVVRRLL